MTKNLTEGDPAQLAVGDAERGESLTHLHPRD